MGEGVRGERVTPSPPKTESVLTVILLGMSSTDIITRRDLQELTAAFNKKIERLIGQIANLSSRLEDNDPLEIMRLSPQAKMPMRSTPHSAGFDMFTSRDGWVEPGKYNVLHTDVAMRAPDGCYIRVAARSGLNSKLTIETGAGVIDRDFTGEVSMIVICRQVISSWQGVRAEDGKYFIPAGTKIAQIIIEKISMCAAVEVDQLSRDKNQEEHEGFGSTGITY